MLLAATRPEIVDFGGLRGPGGPKTHRKRFGASPPPPFPMGFWAAGAALTPQIDALRLVWLQPVT